MRRLIDLVDFGLSTPAPIFEVEVIDQLAGEWREFSHGEPIGEVLGLPVFETTQDDHLIYQLDQPSQCYMICSTTATGWKMLMEARVKPGSEKQGLSSALLHFITKRCGRLILDFQMSPSMIQMVEKLIGNRVVSASVANLQTGEMKVYNPDRDQDLPMYDKKVGTRPPIDGDLAKSRVWILEQYRRPRSPLLSEMIRTGPTSI